MAKQPVPTSRGLEYYGKKTSAPATPKPAPTPTSGAAVAVQSWGSGFIVLKMSDGSLVRREGGTIAWRYHNVGNLKYGSFTKKYGAIGQGYAGHAVFPTKEKGEEAMKALLFTSERGYNNLTIYQAIEKYAPASDGNNPASYANYVAKQVGVTRNTKLGSLNKTQQNAMIEAMKKMEGFKEGTIKKVG